VHLLLFVLANILGERHDVLVTARAPLAGIVRDSATGVPIPGVTVRVTVGGSVVATRSTGPDGRYSITDIAPGTYRITATRIGCRAATRTITVPVSGSVDADFTLAALTTQLPAVSVTAAPVAVDIQTGNQTFQQDDYHGAPTSTTSQVVQQAIAGAARAPTGEVHIRGQHAEYTYYIDGVPVPSAIGGTLNELFDPAIADRIGFQTGGWDAEYGNKNIAVINVETKIPADGVHYQLSGYGGSFNSDGQSLLVSGNAGPFGLLLSGTRQETSMRREPVMQDASGNPLNFHNAGQDQYAFAKAEYRPSARDAVTLEVDASRTHAGIPYDSSFGVLDDHQTDWNGFLNLAWRHHFADESPTLGAHGHSTAPELFLATYVRHSTLDYVPGAIDQPQFVFFPDTTDRFNVQEHRIATTTGVKADYSSPVSSRVGVKTGFETSLVEGREDFNTVDARGIAGPSVNTGVRGGDAGAYTQAVFDPTPHWELRAGVRLDHHIAPIAGDIHQVSPRVRLNWFPTTETTVWFYYGRLFIPSNVEDFHVLAAGAQGDTVGQPTVPERDHYFEIGAVHRFGNSVTAKFTAYYRNDSPAIDDNTLPGTALVATVNIANVHVTGIESAVAWHPSGPLSGYVNAALSHASAIGPVTGGFFPTPYPSGWFDQDHDQRLSIVASETYALRAGFASVTGTFGSGLTNGNPEAAPNETGLFDFNPRIKVAPSFIVNAAGGRNWTVGATTLQTEVSVDNVFDRRYILKGAFTSGPSVGRPRSIQLKVTVDR
jgi:hypothetical protein